MSQDRRNLSFIIGGIVVIAVIVAVVLWKVGVPGEGTGGPDAGPGAAGSGTQGQVATSEAVPVGTVVPGLDSKVPDNVAKPVSVSALGTVEADSRTFEMQLDKDRFQPDTVIINANDLAYVRIHAVDKAYTIVQPDYGISLTIPKGETKTFAGQFTSPGKYLLYCSSCGGPEQGPKGYLVAVPKE